MNIQSLLKPTFTKIIITLILMIAIFAVGGMVFHNPVWIKTGCAPNLSSLYSEICMSYHWYNLPCYKSLVLIPFLYFVVAIILELVNKEK